MIKNFVNFSYNSVKANTKALKTYKQCQIFAQADLAYFGLLTASVPRFKQPVLAQTDVKLHRFNNHLPYVLINLRPERRVGSVAQDNPFIVPRIIGGQINLSLKRKANLLKNFKKASLSARAAELALACLDKSAISKPGEGQKWRLIQNEYILGCVMIRPKCVLFISTNELKQSAQVQSVNCLDPEFSLLKPLKKALTKQTLNLRFILMRCVSLHVTIRPNPL